jgi:hypothetical protein
MSLSTQISRAKYWIAAQKFRIQFNKLKIFEIKAGYDPNEPRNRRGKWTRLPNGVDVRRAEQTGNKRIDNTTDLLVGVISDIVAQNGPGKGRLYGIAIHTQAAVLIRSLDLPGIGSYGVEQSFSAGGTVRYGLDGSIRTDIILRNGRTADAPILAVYDIKTGTGTLNRGRTQEIREALGIDESIPVIELHVLRGVMVKSLVVCH